MATKKAKLTEAAQKAKKSRSKKAEAAKAAKQESKKIVVENSNGSCCHCKFYKKSELDGPTCQNKDSEFYTKNVARKHNCTNHANAK